MKQIFSNAILKENAVFVLLIGLCPTLAVSTTITGALSMGLATSAVLICSNIIISAVRKIIPSMVRMPCYIVIISGFVTITKLLLERYAPALDKSLGIYVSLIVVNCIIFFRAEAFAAKNTVVRSAADGLATGIGFTLAITLVALVREVLGSGTIFGLSIPFIESPAAILALPAGGFFALAFIVAAVNFITRERKTR